MANNRARGGGLVLLPVEEYRDLIERAERGEALAQAVRQGAPYHALRRIGARRRRRRGPGKRRET